MTRYHKEMSAAANKAVSMYFDEGASVDRIREFVKRRKVPNVKLLRAFSEQIGLDDAIDTVQTLKGKDNES